MPQCLVANFSNSFIVFVLIFRYGARIADVGGLLILSELYNFLCNMEIGYAIVYYWVPLGRACVVACGAMPARSATAQFWHDCPRVKHRVLSSHETQVGGYIPAVLSSHLETSRLMPTFHRPTRPEPTEP